jgi:hypothetical protein
VTNEAKDWRGTPITEGALVIYGASVGRSVTLVEGVVSGFTHSGRVWIEVTRRAWGSSGMDGSPLVHVGPDRLTVVTELPPTNLPTEDMKRKADRLRLIAWREERIAELEAGDEPEYKGESVEYHRDRLAELVGR